MEIKEFKSVKFIDITVFLPNSYFDFKQVWFTTKHKYNFVDES